MEVIELFKKLLSYPSITPDDANSLKFIQSYLSDYKALWFNKEGVKNLFLYKKFTPNKKHLCFAGHIDVVPPGEGWKSDPFSPVEKDSYIFARGAQDMKSGVAASIQALKEVKKFDGTLSLLLTSDEEGEAIWGTRFALEELEKKGLLPDYAIVAEPTCVERFGDNIKIGRRGSINGVLEIFGKQGHAAYPQKSVNPIHQIAPILPKIAGKKLDEGDEYFQPSQLVITDIRAGIEKTNVTPEKLKLMFNVRNSTKTTLEDVEGFIKKSLGDLNYQLTLTQSAHPFLTNQNSKIVQALKEAIQKVVRITPNPSTSGGTSDARFFAQKGVDTVEFGVSNDTIHAPNERVLKEEVVQLYQVFKEVIPLIGRS